MTLSTKAIRLDAPVGVRGKNNRGDVFQVETALDRLGYLNIAKTTGELTGYFGTRHDQAIKKFQKDKGLKKDGLMLPNGPTAQKMAEAGKKTGAEQGASVPSVPFPSHEEDKALPPGYRWADQEKRKPAGPVPSLPPGWTWSDKKGGLAKDTTGRYHQWSPTPPFSLGNPNSWKFGDGEWGRVGPWGGGRRK